MNTKLTLKLDKSVIDKAKVYASSRKRSLSRIIESYLRSLVEKEEAEAVGEPEISPFVKSMATGISLPADLDYRKEYREHLTKKHQ